MSDLISREAAIEAIEELKNRYLDRKVVLAKAQDAVNNLPTAEKVGKWIKNENTYGWHCSACEKDNLYAFVEDCDTDKNELQDHYCPNCGATMMEGVDDEHID